MSKRSESDEKLEGGPVRPAAGSPATPAQRGRAAEPADAEPVVVRPMQFEALDPHEDAEAGANLDLLMDVGMRVAVELGRTSMSIREVLSLTRGSVVELDKMAGEPVDIYVNDTMIAHGEVVVVGEKFGVRVTQMVSPERSATSGAVH